MDSVEKVLVQPTIEPKEGDEVHYVTPPGFLGSYTPKKHIKAKINRVVGGPKKVCDLSIHVEDNFCRVDGVIPGVPLALSREEMTWHPVGGYGCDG